MTNKVFIIAEAGVNHNGDVNLAKKLIDIAVDAGADAVKFQTFIAEELVSANAPKANYQKNTDDLESQQQMLKKLELSNEEFKHLSEYAKTKDIVFLSTPFDKKSVDLVVQLGVPLIKVGSGEITNHPLLKYIADKKLPIILSTGMSTLDEVADAVLVIKNAGCKNLTLLHCTSDYPAQVEDCNLLAMKILKQTFDVDIGYSDHTLGIVVPIAAVSLGAKVIEKHITFDKNASGSPDHKASLDADELKEMICNIRLIEKSFGSGIKAPVERELSTRNVARKSIVAAVNIEQNTIITDDMLNYKRPGCGISPKYVGFVVGRTSKRYIRKGTIIAFDDLCSS